MTRALKMADARYAGFDEGFEQGMEKGAYQSNLETARRFLEEGPCSRLPWSGRQGRDFLDLVDGYGLVMDKPADCLVYRLAPACRRFDDDGVPLVCTQGGR